MGAFVKRRSDVLEAIRKSLREEKEAVSNTLPVPVYNTLPAVLDEKLYKSGTSLPPPQENEPKKVIFVDETGNASFDLEKLEARAYGNIRETFLKSYERYRKENPRRRPGIFEFAGYSGLDYLKLKKLVKEMGEEGLVKIVKKGSKKEICLAEDLGAESAPSSGQGDSENGRESFNSLLENAYVRDYLSKLLSNNGISLKPETVVKIVNKIPFYGEKNVISLSNGKTDGQILEALKTDHEVLEWFNNMFGDEQKKKKGKKESAYLSKVRHCLFELYDKKLVSYTVEDNRGWKTYFWYISPSASSELKKSCISEMEEKKKNIENMKQENNEYRYYCKENKTHPVIPFGSKSFVDDFKCGTCGSDLVLEAGSQIAESINQDLEKLNLAIGEIGLIEV